MNKYVDHTVTNTKRRNVFTCKKDYVKAKIRNRTRRKTKKYTCANVTSPLAIKQLKRLLHRGVIAKRVTAPKQKLSNCWFNVMFMSFFISDHGYKYTKYIRQLMIEGKTHDKTNIPPTLRMAFARFNMCIQASIDETPKYYLLNNTNIIIRNIVNTLKQGYKSGENGNPIVYYNIIFNYLIPSDEIKRDHMQVILPSELYDNNENLNSDCIIINYDGNAHAEYPKMRKFKIRGNRYVLDSAIISNDEHFISFLTIKGKEYGFDGASFSELQSMRWKHRINENRVFNLDKRESLSDYGFNFMDNYHFYFYFKDNKTQSRSKSRTAS